MRIVNGKDVSVEISFHELGKELQTKVYRSNKEKMAKIASESHHYELRKEVAKDATSSEFLTKMLINELHNEDVKYVIFEILKNPLFELNDELRKELITSDCAEVRQYVAMDYETPTELLNQMLKEEIEKHGDPEVIYGIAYNSNFEMNDEFRNELSKSESWKVRLLIADDNETSKDLLNQMLLNEIQRDFENRDVTETIINNGNFEINKHDLDIYAKAKNPDVRVLAAEDENVTGKFLMHMLYDELEGEEDEKVIETIIYNEVFKKALIE